MRKYTKKKGRFHEVWSPLKQVYEPKKKEEVPTTTIEIVKRASITTGSIEVSVNVIDEQIVIKNLTNLLCKK